MTNEEMTEVLQDLIQLNQSLVNRQHALEGQLLQVTKRQQQLEDTMREMLPCIREVPQIVEMLAQLQDVDDVLYATFRNLKYELADVDTSQFFRPQIMTEEASVREVIDKRRSLARYGDGEFGLIFGISRMYFQDEDAALGKRLLEVLQSDEENLLIGIADVYGNLDQFRESTRYAWRRFLTPEYRARMESILSRDKVYANSRLSRPYIELEDMHTEAPAKRFALLKEIWRGQDVVVIEGSKTGMGIGNDLFAGAKRIRRIVCPAENAFLVYEDIVQAVMQVERDCLILMALGPTATVLAYDLCKAGYWAVDIGHIDLEYEWFLRKAESRTPIPGKYVNEVQTGRAVEDIQDADYDGQVIARVGC